jgi:hypothetical protein
MPWQTAFFVNTLNDIETDERFTMACVCCSTAFWKCARADGVAGPAATATGQGQRLGLTTPEPPPKSWGDGLEEVEAFH